MIVESLATKEQSGKNALLINGIIRYEVCRRPLAGRKHNYPHVESVVKQMICGLVPLPKKDDAEMIHQNEIVYYVEPEQLLKRPLAGKKRKYPHVQSVVKKMIDGVLPFNKIQQAKNDKNWMTSHSKGGNKTDDTGGGNRTLQYMKSEIEKLIAGTVSTAAAMFRSRFHQPRIARAKGTPLFTLQPVGLIGSGMCTKVVLTRLNRWRTPSTYHVVKLINLQPQGSGVTKASHWNVLKNEVDILCLNAALRSPYLLYLEASFVSGTFLCLVTPFMRGGDLQSVVVGSENRRLVPALARFYCAELAAGVGALHQRGVIHCDLEPRNVLLTADGHVVISDFSASVTGESASGAKGTPSYSAPEKLAGELFDASSDWWSVGLILHFMLFGSHPAWDYSVSDAANTDALLNSAKITILKRDHVKDERAYSFIDALLTKRREDRLGCGPNGYCDVLSHPYLNEFNRYDLERAWLDPPAYPKRNEGVAFFAKRDGAHLHPFSCHKPADDSRKDEAAIFFHVTPFTLID